MHSKKKHTRIVLSSYNYSLQIEVTLCQVLKTIECDKSMRISTDIFQN